MNKNCKYCKEGIPVIESFWNGNRHSLTEFDRNRNIKSENKRSGIVMCGPEDDSYEIPYYYGELK